MPPRPPAPQPREPTPPREANQAFGRFTFLSVGFVFFFSIAVVVALFTGVPGGDASSKRTLRSGADRGVSTPFVANGLTATAIAEARATATAAARPPGALIDERERTPEATNTPVYMTTDQIRALIASLTPAPTQTMTPTTTPTFTPSPRATATQTSTPKGPRTSRR